MKEKELLQNEKSSVNKPDLLPVETL